MPWIKAELSEQAHKALKHRSIDEDKTLDEIAADIIEGNINE